MQNLGKIILTTGFLFATSGCIPPGGPRYPPKYNSMRNSTYNRDYLNSRNDFFNRAGPQIYSPYGYSPSARIYHPSHSYGRTQSYRFPQSHNSDSYYNRGSTIKHYNSSPSHRQSQSRNYNSPPRNYHSGRR